MSYYCAECNIELEAEELVDDIEEGIFDDICCPFCKTAIPELDPLNKDGE